jgi:CDP-glycerol glycerophosphotransferase
MKGFLPVRILSFFFRFLPIGRRKILFLSYYGSMYGCNPKYISDYFVNNNPEWNVVWAFTEPEKYSGMPFKTVRYMSVRFFYELCTSRVFVTNFRMPEFYRKRRRQLYIQTWHSSMRLKAIEADAGDSVPNIYRRMARHDSKQISFLLSGCEKSSEIFRRAFWYAGEILPTGTPRIDILFSNDQELKMQIRAELGLDRQTHVVTYAPTFRESKNLDVYDLDLNGLCKCLHNKWGGNWCVLLRLHPHLSNLSPSIIKDKSHVLDVTKYGDVQELLAISDVVVSDYSSLVFDFAFTFRPCFLYVPDLKDYLEMERKLYFKIEDLPYPIIHDNKELTDVINQFNEEDYKKGIKSLLKEVGTYETGHACENVYQAIMNHLS